MHILCKFTHTTIEIVEEPIRKNICFCSSSFWCIFRFSNNVFIRREVEHRLANQYFTRTYFDLKNLWIKNKIFFSDRMNHWHWQLELFLVIIRFFLKCCFFCISNSYDCTKLRWLFDSQNYGISQKWSKVNRKVK